MIIRGDGTVGNVFAIRRRDAAVGFGSLLRRPFIEEAVSYNEPDLCQLPNAPRVLPELQIASTAILGRNERLVLLCQAIS